MLSLALAGKPNAGKSTFFEAATTTEVDVANYPFTTVDPNRGVSSVRTDCPCLDREERCDSEHCRDGKRYVPVELLDVAGLVPGAHEGKGLGNQFLDELTTADAILNVVDASGGTNAEGEPVEVGDHDPIEDVDFVASEIERWLAGIIARNWETVERGSRSPGFSIDDHLTELLSGVGASELAIAATLRELDYPDDPRGWTDDDRLALAREIRARTKPLVVVANKADVAPADNLDSLAAAAERTIPATADGERALRRGAEAGVIEYDPGDSEFSIVGDLSAGQRSGLETVEEVVEAHGGTGIQRALNEAVYDLLDHITVYPVQNESKWTDGQGNVLPDAFLVPRGSTPRDLAFAVHSDIGEGYLHAVDARSNREIGDDHELAEGDVVKIVSTAK